MRVHTLCVFLLSVLTACGSDSSGPGDDAPSIDADVTAIDGNGGTPDADPGRPDANANCAADMTPPGAPQCPSECTECLPGNICRIDCPEGQCNDTTVTCPADYACEIVCTGVDGCDSSTIECPAQYGCAISCDGPDACGDITLECGAGPCSIACTADSCTGAQVACGSGACGASCTGAPAPTLDCASSCACTTCP